MLTLDTFLGELYDKTAKQKTKAEVESLVSRAAEKMRGLIMRASVSVRENSSNLQDSIEKMQTKPQPSYEALLREHRLREAKRAKQELEDKLYFVEDKIQVLTADEVRKAKMEKQTRRLQLEQEEKKRVENEEFARRQMEQQKALEQRRERLLAEMALAQQERDAQAKLEAENLQHAQVAERERRVEALRQKRAEREQQLAEAKVRLKETKDLKPPEALNLSLPEIEMRKPQPRPVVKLEEIEEHQRKYQERLKAEEERRRQKLSKTYSEPHFPFSKSFLRLSQEERRQREEAEKQAAVRAQTLEKQKQYSQLVRTTYFPAIDKKKAEESQSFLAPKVEKKPRNASADTEKPVNLTVAEIPKPRPRKRRPKPEAKEEKKVVPDYLEELRKTQAGIASKTLSRIQSLAAIDGEEGREKVMSSEVAEKVRKTEAVLSRLSPTQPAALQIEESLNSLLIDSIKAKLCLLSS